MNNLEFAAWAKKLGKEKEKEYFGEQNTYCVRVLLAFWIINTFNSLAVKF